MKLRDALIAWTPANAPTASPNPTRGQAAVGPNSGGWSRPFTRTVGSCFSEWRKMSDSERERALGIQFATMVIRDGMDPKIVHRAFLSIDEYRQRMITGDTAGATDEDDQIISASNWSQLD